MEYVYAAMLLNAAGKDISEQSMTEVIKAAGLTPDEAKVKSVVESLKGVDIKSVIENAQSMQVAAAPGKAEAKAEGKKESKAEAKSEAKSEEEAAGGLAGLFG
ncbi:50S ribosomal protein L12p [Candidatus Mancarchaeum acidiphilum]|uniref:Large ribosomal subunit protein P1 n=1 Tax=Candidatus Mancarchaeum acidiphilum TaxID=1920749 RepID=A0A218NNM9_9ARCH|nr:50S ribosomal protein P1 [Candidatus Mancarchaeum acidiphilum]ASI14052.1 50S ribosomal protein L12p [Candidatus Mancarchaeum acidiphilum]